MPAAVLIILVLGVGTLAIFGKISASVDVQPATPSDSGGSTAVRRIAEAIAFAEGFYVPGTRPARNHNPGDMTADLIGKATGHDGIFVVYDNDDDGWANLYKQVSLWLSGDSQHADDSTTIAQIASFYTTTEQQSWAANVAAKLGVSTDTSIGEV